ncbi:Transcription factor MYB1R1 [Triticum urartu]|uniref:Transcription factor MYB1R1 n=1 Tax=Triticum urartu TaxID=4572 RepID=M7ZBJ3_TRIUA|nr:Transcription factor MYB1R1 [Triticum urartu]
MVTEGGFGFGSGGWMWEQDMVFENALLLVDLQEGEAVWNNMAGVVEVKKGSGSGSGPGGWTWEQNKAFENALALVDLGEGEAVWNKIADAAGGKTAEEIKRHYELLVADVDAIEAGRVPLPVYTDGGSPEEGGSGGKKGCGRYGKGDWRSISRNFVISRTPTQVASHAQKYFIRLNSMNRERRRSSIHDITSVNGEASAAQGPITGTNGQAAVPGKSPKQSPHQPGNLPPGVDAFGTTIGQPVGGPLVSAVGTPVTLPVAAPPHMGYAMHAPVPGTVVPRAPMYPMPPPPSR